MKFFSQIQEITNKVNTKIEEQQNTMNTLKEEIKKVIEKNNYYSEKILNIQLQNEKIEDDESFRKR